MKRLPVLIAVLSLFAATSLRADTALVFNEIMYHPATNEPALEWIEFHNQLAVDLDVSGWSVSGGIDYAFPNGSVIRGRGFAVLAIDPAALMAQTGLTGVFGPFAGRLSNNGESFELRNNSGRVVDAINYEVDGNWPVGPDGAGVSLAKRDRNTASAPPENWTVSAESGGTPGADNFPLVGVVLPDLPLITAESVWKYEASGVDPGPTWRGLAYNDSAWSSGAAWLYHGAITVSKSRALTNIFSTGIGTNGVALAQGARDPHYVITAAAQGATNTNAVVMINNPAWLGNDANSTWIGVVDSGNVNIAPGAYNYRTTFDTTGLNAGSVQVEVNVAADDRCNDALLNGASTGISVVGFAGLSPTFTLSNGIVAGINTLEFRSANDGTGVNPGGFRAQLRGSGQVTTTNTALPPGANTYYFRKSFTFSGDPVNTALSLNALIDDGAVFYLNGTEIHRVNMPAGPIGHSTPAVIDVPNPASTGPIAISHTLLVGQNVLAVEVHQAAGGGADLLFEAELIATPRVPQPLKLAFNEHAPAGTGFWVELFNYGTNAINLGQIEIIRDGAVDSALAVPTGTLEPGAFVVISNAVAAGDKLYLLDEDEVMRLLDAIVIGDRLRGRSPAGSGRWLFANAATPGAANSFALHTEIVINEIMYNHQLNPPTNNLPGRANAEEWIELYNRSGGAVDITDWEIGGGIEYRFTPGTIIPAGGYLVVADDTVALGATYPGIDIVGNFGGRLSGQSDRITLRDAAGNPADEVRYFDGGRWPEYADGGGSSLELRDPNADNAKAEAWAASDESDKTAWQNYSYIMTANIPGGSGQPTQWNDFILGLQSGGECLIDDITVVETNGALPMIDNGNFENGITGWRVLGTHNRSQVIVDPADPDNHVLHVVASGPQEHMHNHIERNYVAGRSVVNGRGYQVTFRARWLAGNNLLNTRLYFNRVARTTALPTPPLNGTPGAQNSRFAPNIGPTFSQFGHQPVVPQPGAPVTVSVVAEDPNGISAAEVRWSLNGIAWNSAPLAAQGNGLYRGTVPGQGGGTVQFYVRAVDGLGAAATFPAAGPDSGALYAVADGQANLPLAHNVRIILTASNINYMHGVAQGNNQTNVMSNDLVPCTVVYDEQRAYYDIGVHLRGSQRGRYSDTRTGYHITFNPDELFLGAHPVMLIDRSGAGDATANRQEEIVLKHMLNRAGGLPGTYSQICRLIAPRSAHTGPAQFFPRHEDLFIETAFENGGDGTMFEMELIYFPTTANAVGYKLPQPDNVVGTDMTDLGNDKEIYRYNFMIKNHRDTDDYSRFIAMCKALALSGSALDIQSRQVMDIDQWMRAYALVSLCSVGDMYTFGNNHNFFMYQRPSDGKLLYFPWDMDFVFSRGAGGALVGDQNLGKLVNLPGNLRCMYAHMLDIISVSFNTAYMSYWTDHYDNFAPGQNYGGSLTTIGGRVTFVQSQIASAGGNAAFAVTGPNVITTNNNLVTFTGTAPVAMKTITVNGIEYPVTWTSVSAWRMVVPVSEASNVLVFAGLDVRGNASTSPPRTNTVIYTGPTPDPHGAIVINEIMYNPETPDTAFVELRNRSAFSFDLSDWRINGLSYTFPKGSIITNGQYLLLVNQVSAYAAAFGTSAAVPFDEFGGNLQNNGETLTLLRPGALPGEEIVVDKVKYDDDLPWPLAADGSGPSLQLIDAAEDNSRVSNWTDGGGWRYFTHTGTVQGPPSVPGTNFFIYMSTAGEVYVDDMKLVLGTVPEAGPNLLANGDFEAPLAGTWLVSGNHSNSVQSTDVSHSGSGSLKLSAAGAGSTTSHYLRQFTPPPPSSAVFTLSFWFLPSTNGSAFVIRTAPGSGFWTTNNFRPTFGTPGAANTVGRDLPAYPDLWLNEVQAENISGPLDGQGEREPWIEIYNSGPTTISLEGCYLANNYSNITQWAFPAGSSIAPGEFKVIFADNEPGESTAGEWHANFRPQPGAGSISFAWSPGSVPEVLDYFNYEDLRANWSYGSYPDGQVFERQTFYRPTPGAANDNTAPPITVFINEWMASNTRTLLNTNNNNRFDDWFELYNPTDSPADLTGYFLTDNLADRFQFPIPPGYVVPPHGFLLVWADNEDQLNSTNDPALHTNFRLERGGEHLGLTAPDGSFIDSVIFEPQFTDISQGRFPDAGAIYFLRTATPRAPNSSWTNRYPVLSPIADQTAIVNELFTYQATASDPDGHDLLYSVDPGAPDGATIDPSSGEFTWTPPSVGTNSVTIRVTDNGPLSLSAARAFRIISVTGIRIGSITRPSANEIAINLGAIPGKTYRAEFKNALGDAVWTPINPGVQAQGSTVSIIIVVGPEPQRFFRVVQLD